MMTAAYQQPVMVAQPMMMAPPTIIQQQPQPQIIV